MIHAHAVGSQLPHAADHVSQVLLSGSWCMLCHRWLVDSQLMLLALRLPHAAAPILVRAVCASDVCCIHVWRMFQVMLMIPHLPCDAASLLPRCSQGDCNGRSACLAALAPRISANVVGPWFDCVKASLCGDHVPMVPGEASAVGF